MSKSKLIQVNLETARELARMLEKFEKLLCTGCGGQFHDTNCPAHKAFYRHNYLTQRINHPNQDCGV